ncbi:MAG: MATE family efflux transporter [Phycisphaerae bacterium]|jgi:MATE family multidrug resistance protein
MSDHATTTDLPAALPAGARASSGVDPGWAGDLRRLLILAGPNVATMVAESLLNMVDFWIASRLGPAAAAAVLTAILVFMSIFGVLMGTMACVCTVASQSYGAGRPRDCSAYAWQGIWISLLVGTASLALWPAIPGLYRLIGHEPDVQVLEVGYTRIRLLILGAAGANMALAEYFNGIQRPRVNTVSVIGANLINAVLSCGLAFGLLGLPRMGFIGIAVGTVIATLVRSAWLLGALCTGQSASHYQARRTWRPDPAKMRRLVKVGWPAGVQFVLEIGAWTAFLAWVIGKFGTLHLAASHTCARLTELAFMPAIGIGYALSTLVGEAVGQGRPGMARRRARLGTLLNMAYMGLMALVFMFLGRHLMAVFTDEPEVIALGARVLVLAGLYQLFDAAAISYSLALRGAGDTLFPAVAGAVLAWGLMVGGSLYVAEYRRAWGLLGPWGVAAVYVVVISLVLWIRWRRGRWASLDVIGRAHPPAEEQARSLDPLVGREAISADPPVIGSQTRST